MNNGELNWQTFGECCHHLCFLLIHWVNLTSPLSFKFFDLFHFLLVLQCETLSLDCCCFSSHLMLLRVNSISLQTFPRPAAKYTKANINRRVIHWVSKIFSIDVNTEGMFCYQSLSVTDICHLFKISSSIGCQIMKREEKLGEVRQVRKIKKTMEDLRGEEAREKQREEKWNTQVVAYMHPSVRWTRTKTNQCSQLSYFDWQKRIRLSWKWSRSSSTYKSMASVFDVSCVFCETYSAISFEFP